MPENLQIEDLDLKLKLGLIFSYFGLFVSLMVIGGMFAVEVVFGLQFGWWLTLLGIVPLMLFASTLYFREKARYLLEWEEDDTN